MPGSAPYQPKATATGGTSKVGPIQTPAKSDKMICPPKKVAGPRGIGRKR